MRHKLLALIGCLVLAATLSACAGMGGADGIPSLGNAVTDVGNPNEEAELLKGIYVNEVYDVAIRYPTDWSVEERGFEQAIFQADDVESLTADFIEIESDVTLEGFIVEVRGSTDGLSERYAPRFDKALCADRVEDPTDGDLEIVECYYIREDSEQRFVMTLAGTVIEGEARPTVGDFTVVTLKDDDKTSSQDGGIDLTVMSLKEESNDKPEKIDLKVIETGPSTLIKPIPQLKKVELIPHAAFKNPLDGFNKLNGPKPIYGKIRAQSD